MNKYQIETRLIELKDCKIIKFTMNEGLTFEIPYENIIINSDKEEITSPLDNFKCFYCSISSIDVPHQSS